MAEKDRDVGLDIIGIITWIILGLIIGCYLELQHCQDQGDRIIELQEKQLELLEQPEVVVLPPMSRAEDERQNVLSEGLQEEIE